MYSGLALQGLISAGVSLNTADLGTAAVQHADAVITALEAHHAKAANEEGEALRTASEEIARRNAEFKLTLVDAGEKNDSPAAV